MKAFIAVLALLLVVFGASIIYFRGDFNVGKKNQATTTTDKNGQLSQVMEAKYTDLQIRQSETGVLKIGGSRTLTAVAKDQSGAIISVEATWTLDQSSVANLVAVSGSETRVVGKTAGKVTVTAIFKDLKAAQGIEVGSGAVAGATTAPTTRRATTSVNTASGGNVGVGNTNPPPAPTPFDIKLYDPSGARFNIGESRTFTSQVQYTDNSFRTPDLTWSVDPGGLGSLNRTTGSSVTFTANGCGGGFLKAVLGNLASSLYLQVCN